MTIRSPRAAPTQWRRHQMRIDLQFLTPLSVDRRSYVFEYEGWRIRVPKNLVELVNDARSA